MEGGRGSIEADAKGENTVMIGKLSRVAPQNIAGFSSGEDGDPEACGYSEPHPLPAGVPATKLSPF